MSSSKQKRQAKKAGKAAAPKNAANGTSTVNGASDATGLSLDSLKISSERTATGVLESHPLARDIKIGQYTLSFFGRVLIENATIELNFGRR